MTVDVKLDGLLDDARELQPRTVALRRCWTAPAPGPRCCFAATWTRCRCARTPGWSSPRRSRAPLRSAPHSRCAPPTTSSRRRPRCPGPCSGGAARQRHRRAGRLRTGQGPARPGDGLRGLLLRAPAGARRHGLPGRLPAGPRPGAVAVQPLPPGGLRRGRAGGGRGDLRGSGAAPARRRRVAWRRANPGTDHLLRSGRRRGDLPPAGVPLLRPLYPEEDLAGAEERLRLFLIQYWGGPNTYSQRRGHPRLRMRHARFVIGQAERDAWLRHMTEAVDSLELPEPLHGMLLDYLTSASQALINQRG